MKGIRTVVSAIALLSSAAAGSAADLSMKDSPASINPFASSFNWSGVYMELGAGPGFTQNDIKGGAAGSSTTTLSSTGATFDFRMGFDQSLGKASAGGSSLLVGVYGEVGNNFDVNGQISGGLISWGNHWQWGTGVKAAYDYESGQIYSIVGYSHQDVSLSGWGHGLDGIKYGGGVQTKIFGPHFYAGLEVTQTRYGSATTPLSLTTIPAIKFTDTNDEVKVKLGYKF